MITQCFLVCISLFIPCIFSSITSPQMWEIISSSRHKAIGDLVSSGDLDVWSTFNDKIQAVVHPGSFAKVKWLLTDSNLTYNVLENNLLDLIRQETEHMNDRKSRQKRAAQQMDWNSYHNLNDIEGYLGWLNATQNDLVSVYPVAVTSEGNRVYVVKVSDGNRSTSRYRKRKIWIEGGIHAREWISPAVTTYLLHQVATSKEFRPILHKTEWYFVPVANPDGYDFTFNGGFARMWRKNRKKVSILLPRQCRGIDLNRNWDLKWGVGASGNPCSNVYKGAKPFSEPESNGLRKVMRQEGPFDLFITFHSYGQTVLYPWGWTKDAPPNKEDLAFLGSRFVEAVKHASSGTTDYKLGGSAELYGLASGASDDWAYGELGVPYSYTIELRDTGKYGFQLPETQIMDTVQETAVGVYCMASYLSETGVCSPHQSSNTHPRRSNQRTSSHVIFE